MNQAINFKIQNSTGIIHLNRPKVLNALNLEMVELFLDKLKKWQLDFSIKRVLLTGEGKALCAGGDIKSLFLSSGKSNLKKLFLQKEYTLNYAISQFSKPYLSIWNGIVMGGGIGLSIYGNARLVTEKVKLAMPETAIGFFPDVGGSYFLSRLNKGIGLYLALTGYILNATEILTFGLATHFENSNAPSFIMRFYEDTSASSCCGIESIIDPNDLDILDLPRDVALRYIDYKFFPFWNFPNPPPPPPYCEDVTQTLYTENDVDIRFNNIKFDLDDLGRYKFLKEPPLELFYKIEQLCPPPPP